MSLTKAIYAEWLPDSFAAAIERSRMRRESHDAGDEDRRELDGEQCAFCEHVPPVALRAGEAQRRARGYHLTPVVRWQTPWYFDEPWRSVEAAPPDALQHELPIEDVITCGSDACIDQARRFAREQSRSPAEKKSRAEYVRVCAAAGYRPDMDY